jgi:hypothetical protein
LSHNILPVQCAQYTVAAYVCQLAAGIGA